MKRLSGPRSRTGVHRTLQVESLERREVFSVGGLDPSFNFGFGKASTDFGGTGESIYDTAFQTDGKIVALGATSAGGSGHNFALARYMPDGTLDPSFGGFGGLGSGRVATDFNQGSDFGHLLLIQPDGKILAIGMSHHNDAYGLQTSLVLSRYLTDGSLDESFGTLGKVIVASPDVHASSTAVSAFLVDGKVQVFGEYWYDAGIQTRIVSIDLANGNLDATFGNNGQAILDLPLRVRDVAQAGDQYILVGTNRDEVEGDEGSDLAVVRMNANGTIDTAFGSAGIVTPTSHWTYSRATSVVVQNDGKIVVGGHGFQLGEKKCMIIRLLNNGALDGNFNIDGMYERQIYAGHITEVALGPNGSIVAIGQLRPENQPGDLGDFAVLKVAADGAPDANFGDNGLVTLDFAGSQDIARALLLYANGKILVAGGAAVGGHYDFALTRIIGQSPVLGAPGRVGRPTELANVNPAPNPNVAPPNRLQIGLGPSRQVFATPQLTSMPVTSMPAKPLANSAPTSNRNVSLRDSLFAILGDDENEDGFERSRI